MSSKRIIKGETSDIKSLPYQVSLTTKKKGFICGGSVISAEWVLTAAHCIPGKLSQDVQKISVRAGSDRHDVGGSEHAVVDGQRHPRYRDEANDWDVALLRVYPPFVLDQTRVVVRLPEPPGAKGVEHSLNGGDRVVVSGWGVEKENSEKPAMVLKKAKLRLVSHSVCRLLYLHITTITDHMICAGSTLGKDACSGDSGGPLVSTNHNLTTQYGVVSFGRGCGHVYHPGVFTNLAHREIRQYIKTISGV